MPFYTVGGLPMHIKFAGRGKPPRPCRADMDDQAVVGPCCAISAYLCDWPVGMSEDAGAHTCDMPLCAAHARQVGRNKHYCPRHHQQGMQPAGAPDQGSAQLGLFTGLLENVTESKC